MTYDEIIVIYKLCDPDHHLIPIAEAPFFKLESFKHQLETFWVDELGLVLKRVENTCDSLYILLNIVQAGIVVPRIFFKTERRSYHESASLIPFPFFNDIYCQLFQRL